MTFTFSVPRYQTKILKRKSEIYNFITKWWGWKWKQCRKEERGRLSGSEVGDLGGTDGPIWRGLKIGGLGYCTKHTQENGFPASHTLICGASFAHFFFKSCFSSSYMRVRPSRNPNSTCGRLPWWRLVIIDYDHHHNHEYGEDDDDDDADSLSHQGTSIPLVGGSHDDD